MANRLRAFYTTPRRNVKRPLRQVLRYKFISFKYLRGGVVDTQLTTIQDYLQIKGRAQTARRAVYIAAESMNEVDTREVLTSLTPEPGPREWLRIEAVPDEVNLADALASVKVLIATVQGIEASSITNKLAYEVSIAYVAAKIARYAAEDSTK